MTTLAASDGRSIRLGRQLGTGGEGTVYRVDGYPNLVAKIYHKEVTPEKAAKLAAMVATSTESILRVAAWPEATLHGANKRLTGFLMRQVVNHRDIHHLYGPRTRIREYPHASYRFLIAVAANVARAFAVVHQQGHVIGDVNQGGVHIAVRDGTASLVDCDSFQVSHHGRLFGCDVGIPAFQPPELQAVTSYRDIVRTSNHDGFGLAVLIFQTLFLGRHPFSGRYLAAGDMSLERAIAEFRFPYARDAARRDMSPPPMSLGLGSVSAALAMLFERAFLEQGVRSRPAALEWVDALEAFGCEITDCAANSSHAHRRDVRACPLCDIESRSSLMLFVPPTGTSAATTLRLDELWRDFMACIEQSRVPAPHELLGTVALMRLPGDPIPARQRANRATTEFRFAEASRDELRAQLDDLPARVVAHRRWWTPMIMSCVAWLFLITAISTRTSPWLLALSLVPVVVVRRYTSGRPPAREDLLDRLRIAEALVAEKKSAMDNANADADRAERLVAAVSRAQVQLEELSSDVAGLSRSATVLQLATLERTGVELHADLCRFDSRRVEALRAFESQRSQRQLTRHMESFEIATSGVKNVGSRLIATLVAYGIETAEDVDELQLQQIRGFGPKRVAALVAWRDQVRRQFRLNPNDPIDLKERAMVEAVLAQQQTARLKDLQQCYTDYKDIGATLRNRLREQRKLASRLSSEFDEARRAAIDARALQ